MSSEACELQPALEIHSGFIWSSDGLCQSKHSHGKSPCGNQLVGREQGAQERAEGARGRRQKGF